MRIIKETTKNSLPAEREARLFIEAWFSMVHNQSLDSHRVRCMNSLNILREFRDLLDKQLSKIKDDQDKVADELLSIQAADKVIDKHFRRSYERLKPLLEAFIKDKNTPVKLVGFFVREYLVELSDTYKAKVLMELEEALFVTKSEDDIIQLVGVLLSVLIDEGYSIEGLFSIVRNVFISNRSAVPKTFRENFDFANRVLNHDDTEYEVIFRLEGGKKYKELPRKIGDVELQPNYVHGSADAAVTSLLSPGQNVLFAKTTILAQDELSAGAKAIALIEDMLDLIRFEFEESAIAVPPEFVSIRKHDNKIRRDKLPSQIPNPRRNIDTAELGVFLQTIGDLITTTRLDRATREKIKSAFQFYRMGKDSDQFENKLLNWWTALEYLSRAGEAGAIIAEVERKLVASLVLTYLAKHIAEYRDSLDYSGVRPRGVTCKRLEVKTYGEISVSEMFSLLQDNDETTHILACIGNHPFLEIRFKAFLQHISNAAHLKAFLDTHEKHLQWHIHRIWRVRSDIVHSAQYSMNITLLCANVEYYLKSLLSLVVGNLNRNKTIESLDELFARIEHAYGCMKVDLAKGQMTCISDMLKDQLI